MKSQKSKRLRPVVCGATFGQVYLRALSSPASPFKLAGLLSRGSDRSRALAERFGVPLYTDPEQLPQDIGVACVVVRSGVVGGRGGELAETLMKRSIHVLQEQPLHHDELISHLKVARGKGVQYHLNPFYSHLEPVRSFLSAAEKLLAAQRALFIDATVALQLDAISRPAPVHVFLSGREAPQHHRPGSAHRHTDEELKRELIRQGGTQKEVFEYPELAAMVLPIVRSDFRLIETYQPRPGRTLSVPITALVGDADPDVTVEEAAAWSENTSGEFDLKVFPGDHFYLVPGRERVIEVISRRLARPGTPAIERWPSTP